eukprot:PhM_4_TR457/c1_g2_i3/m.31262
MPPKQEKKRARESVEAVPILDEDAPLHTQVCTRKVTTKAEQKRLAQALKAGKEYEELVGEDRTRDRDTCTDHDVCLKYPCFIERPISEVPVTVRQRQLLGERTTVLFCTLCRKTVVTRYWACIRSHVQHCKNRLAQLPNVDFQARPQALLEPQLLLDEDEDFDDHTTIDVAVIESFLFSGMSVQQLSVQLHCIIPFLSRTPLPHIQRFHPPAAMYHFTWKNASMYAQNVVNHIATSVAASKLVLCIDGGMCETMRMFYLVVCVHCQRRCYVLQPTMTSKPLNAASIYAHVKKSLDSIGKSFEDVLYIVRDGCAANDLFIDTLQRTITAEDEKWLKENAKEPHQIQEFLRDHFSGKAIYCRGHWIKVILDHVRPVLEKHFPIAVSAVKLFSQMFYKAPTRTGRFREKLESDLAQGDTMLREARTTLSNVDSFTEEEFVVEAQKILGVNCSSHADALARLQDKVDGESAPRQQLKSPRRANETRWLHSTWESYVFFSENIATIRPNLFQTITQTFSSANLFQTITQTFSSANLFQTIT